MLMQTLLGRLLSKTLTISLQSSLKLGSMLFLYRGSTLLWVSKTQTDVALLTMEAKYVALSQSMSDLIPICQLLQ